MIQRALVQKLHFFPLFATAGWQTFCTSLSDLRWYMKCLISVKQFWPRFFEHLNFSDGAQIFRGFRGHPKASISGVYSDGTPHSPWVVGVGWYPEGYPKLLKSENQWYFNGFEPKKMKFEKLHYWNIPYLETIYISVLIDAKHIRLHTTVENPNFG